MAEPARSGCPINAAVEAFGDSWSLLVLRDVMFGNKRYFRELLAGSQEGIASNILADRLKRLVGAGLLTALASDPAKVAAVSSKFTQDSERYAKEADAISTEARDRDAQSRHAEDRAIRFDLGQ